MACAALLTMLSTAWIKRGLSSATGGAAAAAAGAAANGASGGRVEQPLEDIPSLGTILEGSHAKRAEAAAATANQLTQRTMFLAIGFFLLMVIIVGMLVWKAL